MDFPKLIKISLMFPKLGLSDAGLETGIVLRSSSLSRNIKPGMKVGITAGSRGIRNISKILREVVGYVKYLGGIPVLLAAMGSHGGGSPAGQRKLLESLGITEKNMGAPVVCSVDCVEIGRAFYGRVFMNSKALECDAVILVNRIKPHTSFHGEYESGLLKMLVVGLGGPSGAASFHRCPTASLSRAVAEGAAVALRHVRVILGLAVLEDAYDDTRMLVPVFPEQLFELERRLLEESRKHLPGLPSGDLDLLIVDEIGKNFSGTGMDTNVIGRLRIQGVPEPESPRIKRILVLDVAPGAHGNAYGIGLADFTTTRLVEKMDRGAIYLNAVTSTFVQRAMIPLTCQNDMEAVKSALKSLGTVDTRDARIIRIHNTLHLNEMLVSESVFRDLSHLPSIQIMGPPEEISFDRSGNLLPF